MRLFILIIVALALTSCVGAGYNPGCKGKENTTPWCTFHPP